LLSGGKTQNSKHKKKPARLTNSLLLKVKDRGSKSPLVYHNGHTQEITKEYGSGETTTMLLGTTSIGKEMHQKLSQTPKGKVEGEKSEGQ